MRHAFLPAIALRRFALAAMLCSMLALPGAPAAAEEIAQAQVAAIKAGIAGAVRGKVERVSANVVGAIKSGEPVFLRDVIRTGSDAGLQIVLLDQTVFTIGPNAAMAIDEFVFDPQVGAGKVTARVVQGAFRFVSGQIAKNEPKDMLISLPQGTIGVRGTAGEGVVDGPSALVVLRGPGPNNNAGEREGRLVIANATGEVLITRPGFATTLGANLPPTDPQRLSVDQSQRLSAAFTPRAAGPDTQGQGQPGQAIARGPAGPGGGISTGGLTGGANATRQSGQGTGGALSTVGNAGGVVRLAQSLNQQSVKSAQDTAASNFSEITTFAQLRTIHSGTGRYETNNINLVAVNGTGSGLYSLRLDVDFGARTSSITITGNFTVGAVTGNIAPTGGAINGNYAGDSGNVTNRADSFTPTGGGFGKVISSAFNNVSSREIARFVEMRIEITDNTAGTNKIATQGGKVRATRQ